MLTEERFAQIKAEWPGATGLPVHELIEGYEDVRERYARVSQAMVNAQGTMQQVLDVANTRGMVLAELNLVLTEMERRVATGTTDVADLVEKMRAILPMTRPGVAEE